MLKKIYKEIFFYLKSIFIIMFLFNSSATSSYEKKLYDIKIKSINGSYINFSDYKGKVILLVNVASYCGFTKQYGDLQKLWDIYKNRDFIVLGVPSNSFNQEKNTDTEVKEFCEVNFDINFPMTSIFYVKGEKAHDLYKWAKANHGNSAVPKWNFYKILINKEGKIENTYNSFTNPISKKIIRNIEKLLN